MSTISPAADDLGTYISTAKTHGMEDGVLVPLLRRNGWPERAVYGALTRYYTGLFGVAPPARSGPTENARDAFYYLLNFITLGFWTVALGQILYSLIAHWLPDAASTTTAWSFRSDLAWQVATVIVAFPAFAYVHHVIGRELRRRPDLMESSVRKWLTYCALVLAAVVVLGDGITFVQALLRGELTLRFILDAVVVLVLGGGVFGYYLSTVDSAQR